jgi:hypothetical protein
MCTAQVELLECRDAVERGLPRPVHDGHPPRAMVSMIS